MSRPSISYGDILNSMKVSLVNGVLVYQRGDIKPSTENITNDISSQENNKVLTAQTKQIKLSQEPIPDEVKKSKVYNKYFSSYKDQTEEPEIIVPKTPEEYRQMILEDKVKRFLAKKRIEKIKPKAMLFANPQVGYSISPGFNMGHTFRFK